MTELNLQKPGLTGSLSYEEKLIWQKRFYPDLGGKTTAAQLKKLLRENEQRRDGGS